MSGIAATANLSWLATSASAWLRFRAALNDPERMQKTVLARLVKENLGCDFAHIHDFAAISCYEDFAARVPVSSYDQMVPWIERLRRGEKKVLTSEDPSRLMPTSGSTGARKLIPLTRGLQQEFNEAIGPWMTDLAVRHPGIIGGPAYWSITPLAETRDDESSAVPVGFAEDSAYLGKLRGRLVDAALVTPNSLRLAPNGEIFRKLTLLYLLRAEDLRLISVWHPSFLTLLLDALPTMAAELIEDIRRGSFREAARLPPPLRHKVSRLIPNVARANALRGVDFSRPGCLWPQLRVISCWGDGSASAGLEEIRRRFPRVTVQPKGLLSTEAFVTFPFAGKFPVATLGHFFEFRDEQGEVLPVHRLRTNQVYEVIVTTSGGLWRYCTGDCVEVVGYLHRTASLRFLGRAGIISDQCGEKLSDAFVQSVLASLFSDSKQRPFLLLAPDTSGKMNGYTLYVAGEGNAELAVRLDAALRANPQYDYSRKLGQLGAPRIFRIRGGAEAIYLAAEVGRGMRLGDIKPVALSLRGDWTRHFPGDYLSES